MITKDTIVCISIAEHPSNFGTMLFNAAFKELHMNALYKSFHVAPANLKAALAGVRVLGIRGCGISMPFKQEAMRFVDTIDSTAKKVGAINTVVNKNGQLIGYNTDYFGAREVLARIPDLTTSRILLLGAGGVANAICCALNDLGALNVVITSHVPTQASRAQKKWHLLRTIPWNKRNQYVADILINATPLGMAPKPTMPVLENSLKKFKVIMDVVVNPLESKMIKVARRMKKKSFPGFEMSVVQAAKQFELYFEIPAPITVMRAQIKKIIN